MGEEGNEGKSIELQRKIQAFIDEQKSILEIAKKSEMPTMSFNGYDVNLNPETGTYTVRFAQTDVEISSEDKDGNFTIYPKAIDQYNKLVSEAAQQGVATLNNPVGFKSEELEMYLEEMRKQEQKQDEQADTELPGIGIDEEEQDGQNKEQSEEEHDKDDKDETEQEPPINRLGQNAMIIRKDTKTGKMGILANILAAKCREQEGLKGKTIDCFAIVPDVNDPNNFGLYAVTTEGEAVRLATRDRTEGKNPGASGAESNVLVYKKDGSGVEAKQPMQMLMVDDKFGFAIFGSGTRNRQITTLSRTSGDEYAGHVVSETGRETEWQEASWDVREGTDTTADQTAFEGDRQQEGFMAMADLKSKGVPDEINPAADGLDVNEVENVPETRNRLKIGIMLLCGFSEEQAQVMTDKLLDPNSRESFQELYEKGQKEVDNLAKEKGEEGYGPWDGRRTDPRRGW